MVSVQAACNPCPSNASIGLQMTAWMRQAGGVWQLTGPRSVPTQSLQAIVSTQCRQFTRIASCCVWSRPAPRRNLHPVPFVVHREPSPKSHPSGKSYPNAQGVPSRRESQQTQHSTLKRLNKFPRSSASRQGTIVEHLRRSARRAAWSGGALGPRRCELGEGRVGGAVALWVGCFVALELIAAGAASLWILAIPVARHAVVAQRGDFSPLCHPLAAAV